MKDLKQKIINILASIFITLVLIGSGGVLGYKMKEKDLSDNKKVTTTSTEENKPLIEKQIQTIPVPAVKFIKINEPHICPAEFTVKGTFNSDNGNYYTKENKNYERIKPDICFASEEFARDSAGFIKKF
jgi:hypothetical protein